MRHAVKGKKLNRDITSRRALFKNLMLSLIEHGQIQTTAAKADAVRGEFEKLLTKAKAGSIHDRRMIDEVLNQRKAVNALVDEIAPSLKRISGFTRVVKLGNRRGDDALMVRLEIVDWKPKKAVSAPVKAEKPSADAKAMADKVATQVKTEESKTVSHGPMTNEITPAKVKQPTTTNTATKRIPQKRITGGGK